MKAIRRFTVRTSLPESISALSRLAANLRWSWHRPTEQLFRDLGPEAWEASGGDPVQVLGSLTREEIQQIAERTTSSSGASTPWAATSRPT